MTWKRRKATVWRRILRGKKFGLATFLGLLSVASFLIPPAWRRLYVLAPVAVGCVLAGVVVAWVRGRAKMVSDVVVEEIEEGERYTAQYCTRDQLQEACDMTEEHYGREYVTGDVAEQWRLANPKGFVSITNAAGELCACFGLLGLTAGFQEQFYAGSVADTRLRAEDILGCEDTKKCQKLYVSGIVVRDPMTFHGSGKRLRAMLWALLQYYRKCFGFGQKRTLYGLAANAESEKLIQALEFRLVCRGEQRVDECNLYELEVDRAMWDTVSQRIYDLSTVCKTPW